MEALEHLLRISMISLLLPMMTWTTNELIDYCETDILQARCARNEVIVMQKAIYGRMELGTCLKIDLGFMDCFSDILPLMDNWCSGRMSCDVKVRDIVVETNPCPEVTSYLQAGYTCIQVTEYGDNCCQFPINRIHVPPGTHYLASVMTSNNGCGSRECPLQLEAEKGQRINITIFDFDTRSHIIGHCFQYATISDKETGVKTTVCRGGERKRHVYISTKNSVEISIGDQIQDGNQMSQFVFEYQAIGCADPTVTADGYIQRDGDHAIVICPGLNGATWEVVCQDGQWIGGYDNCSLGSSETGEGSSPNISINIKSRITIILIVAVAVIVAIAILVIGVVCLLNSARNSNQDLASNDQRGVCGHPINSFVAKDEGNEMQQTKMVDHASIYQHGHKWKASNMEHASLSSLLHGENTTSYVDRKSITPIHDISISPGNNDKDNCDLHQESDRRATTGQTDYRCRGQIRK